MSVTEPTGFDLDTLVMDYEKEIDRQAQEIATLRAANEFLEKSNPHQEKI